MPPLQRQPVERVEVSVELNKWIWARAGAKIAVGCASLVFSERWLDSPQAAQLQGWLWDDRPRALDGISELPVVLPQMIEPGGVLADLCSPPEHLLAFWPLPGTSAATWPASPRGRPGDARSTSGVPPPLNTADPLQQGVEPAEAQVAHPTCCPRWDDVLEGVTRRSHGVPTI
jgi:hypothetical protein